MEYVLKNIELNFSFYLPVDLSLLKHWFKFQPFSSNIACSNIIIRTASKIGSFRKMALAEKRKKTEIPS